MNKIRFVMEKKRITVDTLGEMISGLENRLVAKIGDSSDRIEEKIAGLDSRIDMLEEKIENVDKKIDFKFTGLQNQIDNHALDKVPRLEHGILKERVKKIERKVGIKSQP